MFIEALFTIAPKWNPPKCPSTIEWIGKLWYVHTMEYYLARKRKELPVDGISLTVLSERGQM